MHIGKEHWLGLDNIYKLTNRKNVRTQLKIILEYKSGPHKEHIVTYDDFHLKDKVVFQVCLRACERGDMSTPSYLNPISTRGGGADFAHLILVSTQSFESHRRTCVYIYTHDDEFIYTILISDHV